MCWGVLCVIGLCLHGALAYGFMCLDLDLLGGWVGCVVGFAGLGFAICLAGVLIFGVCSVLGICCGFLSICGVFCSLLFYYDFWVT